MHHFEDKNGELFAEDVPLAEIAAKVGTPTYVYAAATLRRHYGVFAEAFSGSNTLIAYSVKANSNLAVIATLAREGAGADVVSEGELARALAAGVPAHKIVFAGVGKQDREIAAALDAGIGLFNVESEPELAAVSRIADAKGANARVALRVNPDVAAGGHAKISTGKAEDKFGVPWADAPRIYAEAEAMAGVEPVGLDAHIGSQIDSVEPFAAAARRMADLALALRKDGRSVSVIDMGGGLGIPYRRDTAAPPLPVAYANAIRAVLDPLDVQTIIEPGRLIAGNAGVLLTRVVYTKDGAAKRFVILDAGMNDLLRPALYDAWHDIRPVKTPAEDAQWGPYDVVGPVCETGDAFARDRTLAPMAAGDLAVILSAGAYGAVQASEYNSRPRPAEVMVDGDRWQVVRPRAEVCDLFAQETIPDALTAPAPSTPA